MKKLIKAMALACAVSGSVWANTNPAPNPKTFAVGMYNVSNTLTLKVFVEKIRGNDVVLELFDAKGGSVLKTYSGKKLKKSGHTFDLKNLEAGAYNLVISNGAERIEKPINLVKKVAVENKIEI